MIGVLLITGLLIIPTAMARNLSDNPRQMVILSIIGGLLSVLIGLYASFEINTSSGPSIVVVALILFILSLMRIRKKIMNENSKKLTKNQKLYSSSYKNLIDPLKLTLF